MRKRLFLTISLLAGVPGCALASEAAGHGDPIAPALLALIAILVTAKLGGELFERLRMPAVLGELIGGIILGNLILINADWSFFQPLRTTPVEGYWPVAVDSLAHIGVIILLFEVGLESTIKGLMKVGGSSMLVAVLGVITPMLLGFGASWIFVHQIPRELAEIAPPGFSLHYVHLFIGSVLCATSVGITARVFRDMGKLQMKESQIILGAAVIDDVLGLIVLAVVSGIITAAELGRPLAVEEIFRLITVAVVFLGGTLVVGSFAVPRILLQASRLRTRGVMLAFALCFAFALSYLADAAGLAPIVGAFAAGLLLEKVHFKGFEGEGELEQLIRPVSGFLVPIFFVLMGIQVKLESFTNLPVLGLAGGLTLAAVAGKLVCGLGVLEKNLDRVSVGIGMIPRGEVGLIFASIGRSMKVIDDAIFSALVIMIIVTTLITPPLLTMSLGRRNAK